MKDVEIVAVGESAVRVVLGSDTSELTGARVDVAGRALAELAAALRGEIVPAYSTLLLTFDPKLAGFDEVKAQVAQMLATVPEPDEPGGSDPDESDSPDLGDGSPSRLVSIPVCYGGECGPDLERVAEHAGMTQAQVVQLHCGRDYPIAMLGFMPGFPYLRGLDPRLATPRLTQPRTRIPAGSVGIGGAQTGVYPLEGPGGWNLIGRTPLTLFDPTLPDPVPYHASDRIRFVPIAPDEFKQLADWERAGVRALWEGVSRHDSAPRVSGVSAPGVPTSGAFASDAPMPDTHHGGSPVLTVLAPGALTSVQDLGRPGYASVGVARGGAADRVSLLLANALVGNASGAACLEFCALGPTLRFEAACTVALAGGLFEPRVNGEPVVTGVTLHLAAGDVLAVGPARLGTYGYLAVDGGFDVKPVLGSRSTTPAYRLGGVDGGALRAGQVLARALFSSAQAPRIPGFASVPAQLSPAPDGPGAQIEVAVVPDPQEAMADPQSLAAFYAGEYRVGMVRDRMGMRLEGPRVGLRPGSADIVSEGIAPGTVQLPPSGQPIVMLADHQTVGGYPKLGCVAAADLWRLAQAAVGTRVHFRRVEPSAARASLVRLQAELEEFASCVSPAVRVEPAAPSALAGRPTGLGAGALLVHDPAARQKIELVRTMARQAAARGLGRLGYDWQNGAVIVRRG